MKRLKLVFKPRTRHFNIANLIMNRKNYVKGGFSYNRTSLTLSWCPVNISHLRIDGNPIFQTKPSKWLSNILVSVPTVSFISVSTGSPVSRDKRQTTITENFRFCSKSDQLKFVKTCMNAPVWNVKCKFKNIACFYYVTCTNTAPSRDWVCQETHTVNTHALCCDYVCP